MTFQRAFSAHVFIGVSLDGYIARLDGDIDWLTSRGEAAEGDLGYETFIEGIDTVVMGRATFETLLTFEPEAWPFGDRHVAVLSTRLPADADPRVTVHRSLDELLEGLVARGTKSVYADGGQAVQSFLRAGLIDDITISTVPVLIGSGLRLFGDLPADVSLTLRSTADMGGGIVQSTYDVQH